MRRSRSTVFVPGRIPQREIFDDDLMAMVMKGGQYLLEIRIQVRVFLEDQQVKAGRVKDTIAVKRVRDNGRRIGKRK